MPSLFFFFIKSYLLLVDCVLSMWGEDNDFNVQAMITRLMWTIWTSLSAVRERPLNLITHSLILYLLISSHMPSEVCYEISYPFPNFAGATIDI